MRHHFEKHNFPVEKAEDQKATLPAVTELSEQELASVHGSYDGRHYYRHYHYRPYYYRPPYHHRHY